MHSPSAPLPQLLTVPAQVYVLLHSWFTLKFFPSHIRSFCWLLPESCSHDSTTCSAQWAVSHKRAAGGQGLGK